MGNNNLSLRGDRIDLQFSDEKFREILKEWKECCKALGGQTARLTNLISQDLPKARVEVKKKYE